jgi:PAS domain S-box-containing protein
MSKQQEFDLSRFFHLALDLLCIASTRGYFLKINRAFQETLGYDPETFYNRPLLEFVHPNDREATREALDRLKAGDRVIDFENRYQTKIGNYRWLEWRFNPSPEEKLIYAAARDITKRRRLEKRLLDIHDDTRRAVGQNLHDNLGQRLTGLYLIVDQLSKDAEKGVSVGAEQLSELAREIKKTDELVGQLSHQLIPAALEREDLKTALAHLANENERLFDISCQTEVSETLSITDPTAATNLYHIAQEATTNCVKYGNAGNVRISLTDDESKVILKVKDDGTSSLEISDQPTKRGLGLDIMEHRAKQLGGSFDIQNDPEEPGLTVVCTVPKSACHRPGE